ncbi:MAG: hypothetical protein ACXU8A_00105 [Burkholderiaceae bacterium]
MITTPSRAFNDRSEPDYSTKPEFSDNDVESFIHDLSNVSDPSDMLLAAGIEVDQYMTGMLVEMSRSWQKNALSVYGVAGTHFWRVMKQAALVRYNEEF